MAFQISLSPSGRQFECDSDETILSAALRAGFILPYGCKNGACGSCKGKVLNGTVAHGPHQERALNAEEEAQGGALFCCAKPSSDVQIEAREQLADDEYPIKKLPSRISKIEKLADDVMLISLQLPANEKLNYRAGQYIEFMLNDGKRRSYSLANAPHSEEHLSLHIRHMPGGFFTDQVFSTVKERDILRFEGPQGSFYLREDSDKPIILLASGTGFAPIKAIMEHLIHLQSTRPVTLYWGGRRPKDLYMQILCKEWASKFAHFTYVPVVSDAHADDQWTGRTGFVHQAVLQDHPDLSGYQVYACGAPIVVESAKRDFVAQSGLPAEEFYADSFTSEADLAKN
ncbi:CDP-6-deoxy-delta-3,4-glucoseen reductase [Undibacterium cyanobacteriorum]|uniref:CDP-6-deoxy-delta-3,4-glucoseen reductase n=1 Tax=Undibacterium cyanobacteriorum TaxID=3073561 RepID=A0ABY9RNK9_9BURK|nr:CDP-6-deoxy-delta-3,4-glucoseen reductase [Undibacterium sp. 20NA77.5]WMW82369.1 CDP-6-deoxy-delta-3,4-glucoseen reductase [Undibacterium sp. 20NA77.5]